jgi:hypothetical protein
MHFPPIFITLVIFFCKFSISHRLFFVPERDDIEDYSIEKFLFFQNFWEKAYFFLEQIGFCGKKSDFSQQKICGKTSMML